MKIYKIATSSIGWILSNGEILEAMGGHENAVLDNPSKFGIQKYINNAYCQAFKSGAVRYSKALSRSEISFEGTKSAISKNIDVIQEISGNRILFVDFYNTMECRCGETSVFQNASELYERL